MMLGKLMLDYSIKFVLLCAMEVLLSAGFLFCLHVASLVCAWVFFLVLLFVFSATATLQHG